MPTRLLLAVILSIMLAACSGQPTAAPSSTPAPTEEAASTEAATEEVTEEPAIADATEAVTEEATEVVEVTAEATAESTEEATAEATSQPETTAEASAVVEDTILVVADISDTPTRVIGWFTPMAEYLSEKLADQGITGFEVKVAPDIETMIAWLASGEVDLYFDSVYPAMRVVDEAGAQPVVRRWFFGAGEYYSMVIARADSGIDSLDGLAGKRFAFDEVYSTSGYMLPIAFMLDAGLTFTETADGEEVPADVVGYRFSGDDENTIAWVLDSTVDAGAISNQEYEGLSPEQQAELVVIAQTEPIARQVGVVSPLMSDAVRDALKAALIGMGEDETAVEALEGIATTQFDDFPEGIEAAFERMRALYQQVSAQTAE